MIKALTTKEALFEVGPCWSCREWAHFCLKLLWQAHLFEEHWPVRAPFEAGTTAGTATGVML